MSGEPPAARGTVNHLRLTVGDIGKAEAFYHPLLSFMGYRLVERSDDRLAWVVPTAGGNLLWFILSVSAAGTPAHDRFAPGLHHLALNAGSRADVDAFHDLLRKHGVTILDPPAEYDYEPGYYAVFFADPDGMKLEYVHVPATGSAAYLERFEEEGLNPLGTGHLS